VAAEKISFFLSFALEYDESQRRALRKRSVGFVCAYVCELELVLRTCGRAGISIALHITPVSFSV